MHEFGHYIAGKIFGFGIEEFAIGFGPKIFKKTKKNGEVFSIRALPLGGYCAFEGENDDDATDASAAGSAPSSDPNAFNNKKQPQIHISAAAISFDGYYALLSYFFIVFIKINTLGYKIILYIIPMSAHF